MATESSVSPVRDFQPPSNYDEVFMQQRAVFADNLKDMRDIRKQLYSAADYFEFQYLRDDQDQLFIDSLKDYVAQALVSTVDHLGSVADKINNSMDQNLKEISETELRFSCIKQRARTCQVYIDHQGVSQQSLVIGSPTFHKRYIIPVLSKRMNTRCLDAPFAEGVEVTNVKSNLPFPRRPHSSLVSSESPASPNTFSFTKLPTNEQLGKRSISPLRFPLKRLGSVTSRSVSPSFPVKRTGSIANRSITSNSFNSRQKFPLERRSSDILYNIHPERDGKKDIEVYSRKTRSLFKALLGIDKSKKDGRMYT